MIAWWHCTMRTPMITWPFSLTSTLSERERALFRFFLCVSTLHLAHTHRGSSNESFIPSTCSCSCKRFSSLCSPFLLHAFPAALFPLPPSLEDRGLQPAAHSTQREYGLVWRVPPLHRFRSHRMKLICMNDFERCSRSWISTQWTIPRYQSPSVFPTSSRSRWNAKPFSGNVEPQTWAAKYLGYTWYIGKRFFNSVFFSTSARHPQESSPWSSHMSEPIRSPDKIQEWGTYLFTISYGRYVVNQRSGVGWFSGWSKIFAINKRNSNAKIWSARCEDHFNTKKSSRIPGRQCSRGDNCSFCLISINVQKTTQPNPSPSSSTRQNERNASRIRSPRGKSPSGRMSRWPCKDYLKGICSNSFCENGILQNAYSTSPRVVAELGENCSYAHRQVEEN